MKAVLFDLDGTLLDTARDLGGALNKLLERYSLPTVPYQRYRLEASNGSLGLIKLGFGDALKDYDFEALRQEFLEIYNNNICVDTDWFPGMEALIASLHRDSIPWGVVTNKPGALTDRLLPNFKHFANAGVCISGDTLPQRKPSPEPLLHASAILDVAPEQCIYVGDAQRDIDAANSAAMMSVLAGYGYLSTSEIKDLKKIADMTCHDVDGLKGILNEQLNVSFAT